MIDTTRTNSYQVPATETTVSLPDGRTMVFVRREGQDDVSIGDTSLSYTLAQYEAGIAKARAAGATITERAGYAYR